MTINKNLVTDYGAVSGGSIATNNAALLSFRTFGRAQNELIILTIPAGTYAVSESLPFSGVLHLQIEGTSAVLEINDDIRFTSTCGFTQRVGFSARVATVPSGQGFVQCLTLSEAAFFPVGRWAALAALEWQGSSGFPPNHQYLQYVNILSASTVTGIVTFAPVAVEIYSSEFPATSSGAYDTGGPATLFLMDHPDSGNGSLATDWDCDVTVNGLTITNLIGAPGSQVYMPGRKVTLNNCVFNACAPIPSVNREVYFNNLTVPDIQIEMDKEIEYMEINGGTYVRINSQSSSVQECIIDGPIVTGQGITGTGRFYTIRNVTSTELRIGPSGYGCTEDLVVESSVIAAITPYTANRVDTTSFSFNGSNLLYIGSGVLGWGPPGALLLLAGQLSGGSDFAQVGYPGAISSVLSVSNEPLLITDVASITPAYTTGPVYVMEHPCRSVTFSNVTGCDDAISLSFSPPQTILYNHAKLVDQIFQTETSMLVWGFIKSISINVTRAYTGAQATAIMNLGGQFANAKVLQPNFSGSLNFNIAVNTKIVGERIYTPTGITGSKTGDVFPISAAYWVLNGFFPLVLANMSGDTDPQKPQITITLETQQYVATPISPPTPTTQPPSGSPNLSPIVATTLRHRNYPVPADYPHSKGSLVSPYGHRSNQRLGSTFRSGSPIAHRIGGGIKLPPRRRK